MKKHEMAFPSEALGQTGMTLRDWFAGIVLSGMYSNDANDLLPHKALAEIAYAAADAMLKERNK